jgi:tol-pal system protein YbgF
MRAVKTLTSWALALVLLAALAFGRPAAAQTPLDPLDDHSAKRLDRMEQVLKELRAIVFQGRETGKPVVVEPADTDAQITALGQKIDDLQQVVTRLTGQLESASHDLEDARHEAAQLREENGALTGRVTALEQRGAPVAAPAAQLAPETPAQPAPPPPDPATLLADARGAFSAGDYGAAETGFRDIVTHYGDTPRGAEARYYLAKIMMQKQDYASAASLDLAVVRQWPATSWAPDATLDLAKAMVGMKQPREACGVLAELDSHYPKAPTQVREGAAYVRGQVQCEAAR